QRARLRRLGRHRRGDVAAGHGAAPQRRQDRTGDRRRRQCGEGEDGHRVPADHLRPGQRSGQPAQPPGAGAGADDARARPGLQGRQGRDILDERARARPQPCLPLARRSGSRRRRARYLGRRGLLLRGERRLRLGRRVRAGGDVGGKARLYQGRHRGQRQPGRGGHVHDVGECAVGRELAGESCAGEEAVWVG
ncbi:hypothetical protein LTR16_010667, partial [Cryomyces antarcticus]